MHAVVVESPAKARTIRTWLGREYRVLACYGHVVELPAKKGSVDPDADFAMVHAETGKRAVRALQAIAAALETADSLILATEPDREGEAIAWEILTWLRERDPIGKRPAARRRSGSRRRSRRLRESDAIDGTPVRRVVFHEVTPDAVREAMTRPRAIDMDLVNAERARQVLDYLGGYGLSRVLWRELKGRGSPGRLQSVALRLICARESEIEAFTAREHWTVDAVLAGRAPTTPAIPGPPMVDAALTAPAGNPFTARLSRLDGVRLDRLALDSEAAAQRAAERVREGEFNVEGLARSTVRRTPAPPFTTSTLLREASRTLGFSVRETMRIARALYEGMDVGGERVGLITFVRTDSTAMSGTAASQARRIATARLGSQYLPGEPRTLPSHSGDAWEAHEAIRPVDFGRTPDALADRLDAGPARLYALIWKRALASALAAARFDGVEAELASKAGDMMLAATGTAMTFDGCLRVYREGTDEAPTGGEDHEGPLPEPQAGEALRVVDARAERRLTGPPPRYTEAALVGRLEELGIARPSACVGILGVLAERGDVALEDRRLVPLERARAATAFLEAFFGTWVDGGFAGRVERDLDRIARGGLDWKEMLRGFGGPFHEAIEEAAGALERKTVLAALEDRLAGFLFGPGEEPARRRCPACGEAELALRIGRYGPFVGCRRHPACGFRRGLAPGGDDDFLGPKHLGEEPGSGLAITLRRGPNGYYVQKGEAAGKEKPPRTSVPKAMAVDGITLDIARRLLALPREVGPHPQSGRPVLAGIGRFGPWVRHGESYASVADDDEVLRVGVERAVALIAEKELWVSRSRGPKQVLGKLGVHPDDGAPVWLKTGLHGPFVAHRRFYASVPEDIAPDDLTLERALDLLARASGPGRPGSKAGRRSGTGERTSGGA